MFPSFSTCTGEPNMIEIMNQEPKFIQKVENGLLYQLPTSPPLNIVHLYGTPNEMGYALGSLLKPEINELISGFYEYVKQMIEPYIHKLPKALQDVIQKYGVASALDLTAKWTAPFTPPHFIDEMKGIAEGANIDYKEILRIAMFPELIKAACSALGAWGKATENVDNTLVVLRALDWGTSGMFQKYPVLSIYHPNENDGHAFSTLSWAGFTGSLTGYSSKVSITEKYWFNYKGKSTRKGIPWNFLFRDILQYDDNIEMAMKRVEQATRTCSVFLGLADSTTEEYELVHYSHTTHDVYNVSYANHTYWPTLPFVDKHTQPSSNPCMNDLLSKYYGNITPEILIRNITAQHQTGDMHAAVYDFHFNRMFISNAGISVNSTDGEPAYNRQWVQLNMTKLFNTKQPEKVKIEIF